MFQNIILTTWDRRTRLFRVRCPVTTMEFACYDLFGFPIYNGK